MKALYSRIIITSAMMVMLTMTVVLPAKALPLLPSFGDKRSLINDENVVNQLHKKTLARKADLYAKIQQLLTTARQIKNTDRAIKFDAIVPLTDEYQRIAPDHEFGFLIGGIAAMNKPQPDFLLALKLLNRAIKINPGNADTHYLLASAHYYQGESKQAKAILSKLIDLSPESIDAYKLLAVINIKERNLTAASFNLEQALKINRLPELLKLYEQVAGQLSKS